MKLVISDNTKFYDKNIATKYCKIFDNLLWYEFALLFGKECITVERYICAQPYKFAVNYSPYYFITQKQFDIKSFHLLNSYNKDITVSLVYKILKKKSKLLTIKSTSRNFFRYYELYKHLDIDFTNNNILLLVDSKYTFDDLEALKYLTKNKKIDIDINLYYFIGHSYSKYYVDYQTEQYKKYKKYMNNFNIIYDIIGLDQIKQKRKYNIIFGHIKNVYDVTPNYEEINNINLKYFSFLVAINNLKKGGKFLIAIGQINKKITCDIILIFSKFFESYDFFQPIINNPISMSGIYIIFNNFKDNVTDSKNTELNNIFTKFLEINPSSVNYNILNRRIRRRYNVWKSIKMNHTDKYPESLLNKPDKSSIYDVFREFNNNYYNNKIVYINKLIGYVNKYGIDTDNVPLDIRNSQLADSIIYAKKFRFNTIKISELNYKKLAFKLNNKIFDIYKTKSIQMGKKDNTFDLVQMASDYEYKLYEINSTIEELDEVAIYHQSCNIFYPGYMEFKLIKYLNENYGLNINYKIYTSWINLYEILKTYKVKFTNSLHSCTNLNESINVMNFYNSQIRKRRKKSIHSSINNKLNSTYDLFIGNCNNIKNIQTINFTYFIKDHKDLYQLKFNYMGKYNIITIYYSENSYRFTSEKVAKLLGYSRNKDFINRNSNEHYLNLHLNKNINILHSHIKVAEKDEVKFLTKLFKYTQVSLEHVSNIINAKKYFKNNINENIIKFHNGSYAENILEKINEIPLEKINKYAYKKIYLKNIADMFMHLDKGGTGIIKFALPLKFTVELDLLYAIYKNFETINFFKPSNITNINEYYIICTGFKSNGVKINIDNKSVITNEVLKNYDEVFIDKIRNIYIQLYKYYNDIIDQLSYLINFQEEIIKNNESVQKLIRKLNEEWTKRFI